MSPSNSNSLPTPNLIVREHKGRPFYEAKFRHDGRQVMRRIGPAWLARDPETGDWTPRRGRVPEGFYNAARAHVRASELVALHKVQATGRDRSERERRARGVTFRELAAGYLRHLEHVKGARPSTLRQHASDLAEPDVAYRRGTGRTNGHVMRALGGKPAKSITTADVEMLLAVIADTGVSPRTVNRVRSVTSAVFTYGCRAYGPDGLHNPVTSADRRREPHPGALAYYAPDEVEAVARALTDGQDAEAVRVAAYTGIRLGELLALRWGDIDWTGSALTISRAMSAGIEGPPKSGHVRRVPLSDQAGAALERLSRRDHFTGPGELVFCSAIGRTLDGSALRRRYKRARDRAGLRPLRWHDLRHTFGSILAANGVDLVAIKDAMGHSDLKTTGRYLHAQPASKQAAAFTAAFGVVDVVDVVEATEVER